MRILLFAFLTQLPFGCQDESISGYTDSATIWTLVELDGTPFPARATITFPSEGKITGKAPCNSYTASQTVPLPWFKIEGLVATEMACPDLNAEQKYFDALTKATLAEAFGDTLILSNDTGFELVFKSPAQE